MNSTISLKPGDTAFVPFWVVLEFIDATPPDPFVSGKILNIGTRHTKTPEGPYQFLACDFEIKPDLIAPGLPLDYIIQESDLKDWARKIADWFLTAGNNETTPNHFGVGRATTTKQDSSSS